jgi:hypothetical protein
MKPIYCMVILVSARVATAAAPTVVDFSSGKPSDYFSADTADRVQVSTVGDTQAIAIANTTARLHDRTVKPSTKYTMNLEAAFEGAVESIEENPRFEIFTRHGKTGSHLPKREIRFLDAAGNPVGRPVVYAMPFRNRHTYQDVFYTPADAVTARIGLASGQGVRLLVSRLSLAETKDEAVLNVNPSFQLGPYNYSGWQNISAGGKLIEREGKTILDTKYGSTGQKIPLPGPGTYAFSARATGNGYNSVVIVRVYDAQGKELMRSSTRRYGPLQYFVPPKNAAYASFLVYSCLLEEVRLLRVGDERAIESLQGGP